MWEEEEEEVICLLIAGKPVGEPFFCKSNAYLTSPCKILTMEAEIQEQHLVNTGHSGPTTNDGRFERPNPNASANPALQQSDPTIAFSDANPTTGAANRFEHNNPNITHNRSNEEHGSEYVIPEDWNRHTEDSGMPEGEIVRRGKRSFDVNHSYRKTDYLKGGRKEQTFRPVQGMHTTKFSCGFMRRQNGEPNREQNSARQIERLDARERRRDFRKQELATVFRVGCGNGVLTGEYGPGYKIPPPQKSRGRKHFNQVLSDQSILEGEMKLKQSSSRFYTELSDEVRASRGKEITSEGLRNEKKSSVLGIGRAEMPSYGAQDNFGKSMYLQNDTRSLSATRPPAERRLTARQEAARNEAIAMVSSLGR